jgi:hypothetical protein
MAAQGSSETNGDGQMGPAEYEVFIRVDAGLELYQQIIKRTRVMLEQTFEYKPSSYHEGERRQVLEIARDIYSRTVTPEILDQIVEQMPRPHFDTIEMKKDDSPKEATDRVITESPAAMEVTFDPSTVDES